MTASSPESTRRRPTRTLAIATELASAWLSALLLAPHLPPYADPRLPAVVVIVGSLTSGFLWGRDFHTRTAWSVVFAAMILVITGLSFLYVADRQSLMLLELLVPALPVLLAQVLFGHWRERA